MTDRILVLAVAALALADGILHLALDIVLFRSRFFLNELSILFLLNFIGYVVLAGAYVVGNGSAKVDVLALIVDVKALAARAGGYVTGDHLPFSGLPMCDRSCRSPHTSPGQGEML